MRAVGRRTGTTARKGSAPGNPGAEPRAQAKQGTGPAQAAGWMTVSVKLALVPPETVTVQVPAAPADVVRRRTDGPLRPATVAFEPSVAERAIVEVLVNDRARSAVPAPLVKVNE